MRDQPVVLPVLLESLPVLVSPVVSVPDVLLSAVASPVLLDELSNESLSEMLMPVSGVP